MNHRGSVLREKTSIEEICVSDADAISHFYSIPSLFHLAYVEKGYAIDEGKEFVKNKLQRSYNNMSDPSKKLYQDKYEEVMELFKWCNIGKGKKSLSYILKVFSGIIYIQRVVLIT